MWHKILFNPAIRLGFVFLGIILCYRPVLAVEVFDLSNFKSSQSQDYRGWLMSEKLDGVRAIWDGQQLVSKRGNPISAPDWFIQQLPPFAIDGELWSKRGDFETIASTVLTQTPDARWHQISYHIFEVPMQKGGLLQRLAVLEDWLQSHSQSNDLIKVVDQIVVRSNQHLESYFDWLVSQGAEGMVVRKPSDDYSTGRLTHALKMKPLEDAECRVVGYTKGKGKYLGRVGALRCELLPEQLPRLFAQLAKGHRPVEIKLGSGLSDVQRQTPPEVGTIVTFEYSGLTAKGLPRFARFKRVRLD